MKSVTSAIVGEACKAKSTLRGTRHSGGGADDDACSVFNSVTGSRIRAGKNNSKVQYIKATKMATYVTVFSIAA